MRVGVKSLAKAEVNYIYPSIEQVISSLKAIRNLTGITQSWYFCADCSQTPTSRSVPRNVFPEVWLKDFPRGWSKACLSFNLLWSECNTSSCCCAPPLISTVLQRKKRTVIQGQLSKHKGLGNFVGEVWGKEDTGYKTSVFALSSVPEPSSQLNNRHTFS